jgi:hypothetical protein
MRPIAIGRKNGLFAGSLLAGRRVAAIMSLIQSASTIRMPTYAMCCAGSQRTMPVRSATYCRTVGCLPTPNSGLL